MSNTAKTEEIRDNLADYTAYTMLATRLHAIETEFDDMLCDDLTGSILEDFEGALSMVGLILNVLSSGFEEKARQIAVNEFGFECEMTEEDEEEAKDIMAAFDFFISETADIMAEALSEDLLFKNRK